MSHRARHEEFPRRAGGNPGEFDTTLRDIVGAFRAWLARGTPGGARFLEEPHAKVLVRHGGSGSEIEVAYVMVMPVAWHGRGHGTRLVNALHEAHVLPRTRIVGVKDETWEARLRSEGWRIEPNPAGLPDAVRDRAGGVAREAQDKRAARE